MAISQRLDLRQSQTLVMTPQLQQAIKLLQLSNIELGAYVDAELERNPLLEREESSIDRDSADLPAPDAPVQDAADRVRGDELPSSHETPLDVDDFRGRTAEDGTDLGWTEAGLANWQGSGGRSDFSDDEFGLEQTLAEETNLQDHLLAQIGTDISNSGDRLIALHLMDMLDGAGWLAGDPADVARMLNCPLERVERVLARLRQCEPAGVFARSLADCLALQLIDRNRYDPAMAALLDNLPMLANRDLEGLKRVCGVDQEDLIEMIAEIRALDPKPGAKFDRPLAQTLVPDVLMRAAPEGGWIVELNADTLPKVLVNTRYFAKVSRGTLKRDERDYLSDQMQSANWLVKSLHQRATTILKVATELVHQQDAFFAHGVQYLRPLILRDIAEAIGMHESTVSRVTTAKYIATPRGVYELKYFFTTAIGSSVGGASHSAEAVRYRIKTMIDQEAANDILSDDRIVEILSKDGIDIARRTVAKYREALKIPSSVQRRREKSLKL